MFNVQFSTGERSSALIEGGPKCESSLWTVIFIMRENKRAHMGSFSDNSQNCDSIKNL